MRRNALRQIVATWFLSLISVVVSGQAINSPLPGRTYFVYGEENQNLTGEHRSILTDTERADEFTFYFRCNQSSIDESYLWNPTETAMLRGLLKRENIRIDTLTIYAYSSPEGPYELNVRLSRKRAEATRDYILAHSRKAPNHINIIQKEENWPGLRQSARLSYHRANREDVLRILSEDMEDAARKQAIRDLDGGRTYRFLIDTLMGPLRNSVFTIRWALDQPIQSDVPSPVASIVPAEPLQIARPEPVEEERPAVIPEDPEWAKRTIFALKTNALYDAVTALNYSIEFPIGKQFSIAWQHYFPWWHTKKELKYCLQYLTLGGEARWWFAPKPRPESASRMLRDVLVGHFVGVYGFWGKTDIQWQRAIGMYQCYPVWSVGLTYGYSLPISRHWNMEFSISAGYARIPYQHYIPSDDWQLLWRDPENTGVLHYFGPTNVAVSFVRPIVIKYRKK